MLERFIACRSSQLLTFYDSNLLPHWTMEECLKACHPRIKASFVIEQGPAERLRLNLEFKRNQLNQFCEVDRQWLRLRDGTNEPADFLDINLLDLEKSSVTS